MNSIDKATDYAQEAAERVSKSTSQAAKALGEKGEQLLSAEQKMVKNCCKYVASYPLTSLLVAVASGYLLKSLLSDR
jgi:ElaB/YqjD/DUF883 family membrane-anchored ribosome-binding protein